MARIEIEWIDDSHDCEICGFNLANGALVRIDGVEFEDWVPHAACYDGNNFDIEDVVIGILKKLGHEVVDG
jgi:hypothetical protein